MSTEESSSSVRFFIQMLINVFLCNQVQKMISKRVVSEEKVTKKTLLIYLVFAITLFMVNQGLFFYFKDHNIYESLGVSRSLNIVQLKQWGEERRVQLMRYYTQDPRGIQAQIKRLQQSLNVLTHPARRLSYDSFGHAQVQYAWAFKFPSFILSTIIGSGSFFVICTFVSLMNKKKSDVKQAFKVQIFAMILIFIWEVDLIISTESRLNNNSPDFIDYFYKAFPIFQRREMLKSIVIPCMSLVEIFVRFFMTSPAQKKLVTYGTLQNLQKITLPVRQCLSGIKNDENLEARLQTNLQKIRPKSPTAVQIFELQRQNIQTILQTHRQELVAKQKLSWIVNYFIIK